MIRLCVHAIEAGPSRSAVFSLPLPPFDVEVAVDNAESVQVVPIGEWPARAMLNPRVTWPWKKEDLVSPRPFGNPPRRGLVTARFKEAAPAELGVTLTPRTDGPPVLPATPCAASATLLPGPEAYHHRDEVLYHYVKREDSVRLESNGAAVGLRAAFLVQGEMRYWQWCEAIPVWSGPLSRAWVVGGHIYTGPNDRPITMQEFPHLKEIGVLPEATISAKVFLVAHADGLVELTAHFTNVQGYGLGSTAPGLPVVEFQSDLAAFDFTRRLAVAEGCLTQEAGGVCRWQPLESTRIFLGNQHGNPMAVGIPQALENRFVDGSDEGFVKGVARSFACRLQLGDAGGKPRRYLAGPDWYLQCGEFGVALPAGGGRGAGRLQGLADDAAAVYLRNIHGEGMSRGGVYRYLDEHPAGRYEFSMDANETISIFRAAYMATSPALYAAAMESARYIADIAIDHYDFNARYHGDTPDWQLFSLIYMRFGGLVHAYQESGDPWFLENAEAVANRWIALNRLNQPRKNMGRDPEPVEGILALYEATGKDHYFQEAEKIAWDVSRSLFDDAFWRSGFGVGPYWGINALPGTPWNGSHLLAGLAEFLIRAHPALCPAYAPLEQKAHALIDKLIAEINRQMPDGVWRSAGGFMFRRYFLLACLSGDPGLIERTDGMIRKIEASHAAKGFGFFKTGHHCAGYLDGPYVYASLTESRRDWI